MNIDVALIDDQDIIRFGIQQLLAEVPTVSLLGSFASVESFGASDVCRQATVVLLDDTLPGIDTAQAVRRLQGAAPQARLLMLGRHLTAARIHTLLQQGVLGFVSKDEPLQETLVSGIRRVHLGKLHFSPEAAAISREIAHSPPLSPRLTQVLELIARGYHVQEIAQTLEISPRAVYAARTRLREALNVKNDAQLGGEAFRRGLIEPVDEDEQPAPSKHGHGR